MNLQGSIRDLQKRLSQLYLNLGQRFSENSLIRELWDSMGHDVSRQLNSLNALPQSFWNQLKKHQDGLSESVGALKKLQVHEIKEDGSLKGCFEQALSVEEPTILKIYVPIIRSLRENWTDQALDFYIMVKAHLARIVSVTKAFSGDPVLIRRSNILLESFEKGVQEPISVPGMPPASKRLAGKTAATKKKPEKRSFTRQKRAHPLIKRRKILPAGSKPLVRKVSLPQRRARR
ncbi:MAG: hypothetical protein HXY24_12525 [Rubrivivax sp.]|nr:hypothetical protein [Rubrivivax sp.]